ncbi:MAG: Peptidyl-prolyl cis-trans isomerase [Microgenomates group bacterium GW2011_GWA2_37_6]|nr:MAG: Peptidyl-prolyl cis-trans isomerase [Microgenomates group bacterium GW2011_GWA2_37_6]
MDNQANSDLFNLDLSKKQSAPVQDITDLKIQELKVGTGSAEVEAGDTITLNYAGFLTDGRKFDSSYDRKQPFTLEIGKGSVIKGFDQGVIKMKLGGKRRIFIPAELGYGPSGQGPIPPNADLIFEVELLDIKKKEELTPSPSPSPSENPEPTPETPSETPTPAENSPTP